LTTNKSFFDVIVHVRDAADKLCDRQRNKSRAV